MNDSIHQALHGEYYQHLDSISQSVHAIAENTYTWYNWYSSAFSLLSIGASFATIAGIATLWWQWKKRRITKDCQKAIFLDLIRHMFIINVILEVVRRVCEHHNYACRPIEGVFARFATLESDTDLGRLSTSSKQYALIHSVNSLLRNFNIAVNIAEKHFADPNCPKVQKADDLREIAVRSRRICDELIELAKKLDLDITTDSASAHIRQYYENKPPTSISKEEEACIPKRNIYKNHGYFDYELGLTDIFNRRIKARFDDIYFIFENNPELGPTPTTVTLTSPQKKENSNNPKLNPYQKIKRSK